MHHTSLPMMGHCILLQGCQSHSYPLLSLTPPNSHNTQSFAATPQPLATFTPLYSTCVGCFQLPRLPQVCSQLDPLLRVLLLLRKLSHQRIQCNPLSQYSIQALPLPFPPLSTPSSPREHLAPFFILLSTPSV